MERRLGQRCPVCQGPTVADEKEPDKAKCRRSTCTFNHEHVSCPRCKSQSLEQVSYANQVFSYSCADCLNKWSVAK